jgi:fructokinase
MILISGEALIDLIPDAERDGRYDAVLGGSPYNVAIGLARLGGKASFVSRLSADANGEALAAALLRDHVDLSLVARDPRPTTLAFVMRGTAQTGSRYSFYLDATSFDGVWPFPPVWPAGARHLHVGSIAALDARHGANVVEALTRARTSASISFDPNIRPLVTPDRDAVVGLAERQASLASLYPGRGVEDTLAAWAALGPKFVVATLGAKGSIAYLGRERLEIAPLKVDVVDTVGAGDSFMSSLLFTMDRDGALGAGAPSPTREKLTGWLNFAARASAITCSRRGSDPPTLADMEAAR